MKTVVGGALGECVHVAGVMNFLNLAELAGWRTVFLGPAVPVEEFLRAAREEHADLVGVSYRLTPETGERLLGEFAEAADELRARGVRFTFGGTLPVAERARVGLLREALTAAKPRKTCSLFTRRGCQSRRTSTLPPDHPGTRGLESPLPLLRHHFGLPTMEATLEGIAQIAEARVLDVISLGTDQDAQENFFHPERQNPRAKGAGGGARAQRGRLPGSLSGFPPRQLPAFAHLFRYR